MLVPQAQRVVYRNNPLVEVVCQLRFPTILKIDTDLPVIFQEAIRSRFPIYMPTVEHAHNVELTDVNGQTDARISHTTTTNHAFISEDRKWRVNLTSSFIALSTLDYTRWEDFRGNLFEPLKALIEVYSPAYFSRIGLRYTDAIDRIGLGLSTSKWSSLVKPEMLGMLASTQIPESVIQQANQVIKLRFDDEKTMVINVGLGDAEGRNSPCLIIDIDTFVADSSPASMDSALEVLDSIHAPVSNYFQWAIRPDLQKALNPETIEEG